MTRICTGDLRCYLKPIPRRLGFFYLVRALRVYLVFQMARTKVVDVCLTDRVIDRTDLRHWLTMHVQTRCLRQCCHRVSPHVLPVSARQQQ